MRVSTKTIFNISCPDKAIQASVAKALCSLDVPQMVPLAGMPDFEYTANRFLSFGRVYHDALMKAEEVRLATSSIIVSDGLLSDPYISFCDLDAWENGSDGKDGYYPIEMDFLMYARVIHIHIKSKPTENLTRRMALNLLHNRIRSRQGEYQRWFVFEQPDIPAIQKQIIECMKDAEVAA